MIPLADEENKPGLNQEVYYICKKRFSTDDDNKKYHKDHIIILEKVKESLIIFII